MFRSSSLLTSRPANLAGSLVLAAVWGLFALSHVHSFRFHGDWSYLIYCAAESLGALLFLVRSMPVAVSGNPWEWLVGVLGTFSPLLFEPCEWALLPAANVLLVLGCALQIGGLLSLNRSFGLIAARRTVKTAGMYRFVRHPLYASYLLVAAGYALSNSSWRNLAVACTVIVLQILRLVCEERVLRQDAAYHRYMQQVPYRLIPLVY